MKSLSSTLIIATIGIVLSAGVLSVALGNEFVSAQILTAKDAKQQSNKFTRAANVGFVGFGLTIIIVSAFVVRRLRFPKVPLVVQHLGFIGILTLCSGALAYAILLLPALAMFRPIFAIVDPIVLFEKSK